MSLRPVMKNCSINISEKSHKEGPTSVGGSLMSLDLCNTAHDPL